MVNKRGATTVFLAIVLSSLILVECTYVILVATLNRNLTFSRAVYNQSEVILASYDRELFRTYGIYAFDINSIDDTVFLKTLEANGISEGETLVASGMNRWTTDDLRRVIAVYYSYRTAAVTADSIISAVAAIISQTEDAGVLGRIGEFMSSDAADYIGDIISGAGNVAEVIANLADLFHIPNLSSKVRNFTELMDSVDDMWGNQVDGESDFDPSDMTFVAGTVNRIDDFMNGTGDVIDVLFHPFAAHYAAYNFDCLLEDNDKSINGTDFTDIHEDNLSDSEYILTGMSGTASSVVIGSLIYSVLFLRAVAGIYTDSETMSIVSGCAEVLDAVVSVLSEGTVVLDPVIYETLIICYMAVQAAAIDLICILQGETISLIESDGINYIEIGYRDFLFLFLNFIPDSTLLERMDEVLSRDYTDYAVEITLSAGNYSLDRRYSLYEG